MAGNPGGRHRAPKPRRKAPVVLLGVPLVALALGVGAVGWLSATDDPTPDPGAVASTPTDSASVRPAALESTRVVKIDGAVLEVVETTTLVEGDPVTIAPSRRTTAVGLTPTSAVVVGADGTNEPFADPVILVAGRTLTIEGRYRLTQCPDLLPTEWPSPVAVVPGNWSRVFTRVEEPQRTARALCPSARSKAGALRDIRVTLAPGREPTVRLRWQGNAPLTVRAIGSASGVATVGTGRGCPKECVVLLRPRTGASVRLRPLEVCPVGGQSNLLTLRVTVGKGAPRTVGVPVRELGRHICR